MFPHSHSRCRKTLLGYLLNTLSGKLLQLPYHPVVRRIKSKKPSSYCHLRLLSQTPPTAARRPLPAGARDLSKNPKHGPHPWHECNTPETLQAALASAKSRSVLRPMQQFDAAKEPWLLRANSEWHQQPSRTNRRSFSTAPHEASQPTNHWPWPTACMGFTAAHPHGSIGCINLCAARSQRPYPILPGTRHCQTGNMPEVPTCLPIFAPRIRKITSRYPTVIHVRFLKLCGSFLFHSLHYPHFAIFPLLLPAFSRSHLNRLPPASVTGAATAPERPVSSHIAPAACVSVPEPGPRHPRRHIGTAEGTGI